MFCMSRWMYSGDPGAGPEACAVAAVGPTSAAHAIAAARLFTSNIVPPSQEKLRSRDTPPGRVQHLSVLLQTRAAARLFRLRARRLDVALRRGGAEQRVACAQVLCADPVDRHGEVRQERDLPGGEVGIELLHLAALADREEVLGPGYRADLGDPRLVEGPADAELDRRPQQRRARQVVLHHSVAREVEHLALARPDREEL